MYAWFVQPMPSLELWSLFQLVSSALALLLAFVTSNSFILSFSQSLLSYIQFPGGNFCSSLAPSPLNLLTPLTTSPDPQYQLFAPHFPLFFMNHWNLIFYQLCKYNITKYWNYWQNWQQITLLFFFWYLISLFLPEMYLKNWTQNTKPSQWQTCDANFFNGQIIL